MWYKETRADSKIQLQYQYVSEKMNERKNANGSHQ